MGASKKVLAALVLTVLVLAGGVFGLRSWLGTDGTEGDDQRAAGERVVPSLVGSEMCIRVRSGRRLRCRRR